MKNHEAGSVLVLFLAAFMLLVCCWATLIVVGLRTVRRIHAQDTADAVALSVAVTRSRGLNAVGFINAVMGPMMFEVEKGPLTVILKEELLLHGESPDQLDSLPDRFWLVYNPLVPSARALKTLFKGLFYLQKLYFGWGSGAQIDLAKRTITPNGMDWAKSAALSGLFINMAGDLQPLTHDSHVPIVYFSNVYGIPFPPIERGNGDLMWLKDNREPRPYTITVQNSSGDLYASAAARPFNRSGAMFPVQGESLGGRDTTGVRGKYLSWFRGASELLQKVARWAGVSWGIEATMDYLQAKDGGWDAQLVPFGRRRMRTSHMVIDVVRS